MSLLWFAESVHIQDYVGFNWDVCTASEQPGTGVYTSPLNQGQFGQFSTLFNSYLYLGSPFQKHGQDTCQKEKTTRNFFYKEIEKLSNTQPFKKM